MQPCAEGISAVKAIAIAQQRGQKIYTINESNRDTALPKLPIGGEVGAEIRNAINAGKEVTFHEARIHEHGWSGYGYSIVDPETGAGAYLIEGKGNGSFLLGIVAFIFIAVFAATLTFGGSLLIPFFYGFGIALLGLSLAHALIVGDVDWDCFEKGVLFSGSVMAVTLLGQFRNAYIALMGMLGIYVAYAEIRDTIRDWKGCMQ